MPSRYAWWMASRLCLIGDSGTGKSLLLIALGTEAAMAASIFCASTKSAT